MLFLCLFYFLERLAGVRLLKIVQFILFVYVLSFTDVLDVLIDWSEFFGVLGSLSFCWIRFILFSLSIAYLIFKQYCTSVEVDTIKIIFWKELDLMFFESTLSSLQ